MIERKQFYIDGKWVDPLQGTDHNVINPTTAAPCGIISLGGQADTDAAVAAAKAALPAWMETPAAERYALVEKLLEEYVLRMEDIATVTSMEMVGLYKPTYIHVLRCPSLSTDVSERRQKQRRRERLTELPLLRRIMYVSGGAHLHGTQSAGHGSKVSPHEFPRSRKGLPIRGEVRRLGRAHHQGGRGSLRADHAMELVRQSAAGVPASVTYRDCEMHTRG